MRLKKLEMIGFKSFVQKTEIVFNEGITAIVGPNGSGKSNIADAVRWVLGEQNARTLRGASMQDVIFNGTQRRKPLGYCEVSLVFDNGDHALPLDFSEVEVTRRVYRNGDSEYYINRASVRLKDVVDLFRDTGIGKEGYSIIGQGRIDEILSRKGEDRRQVFEEAAGIVKFKARKEEADRKLARTLDNMARVDDLLSEMKRQLDPLEEQAKNARVYLELAAELKTLDLNLFLVRSDKMTAKLKETDAELQAIREILDGTEVELHRKTEERDRRQAEIAELEEKVTGAREALMAGMEAVHAARDALRETEERKRSREENARRMEEENAEAAERLAEMDRLFREQQGDSEQQSGTLDGLNRELDEAREAEKTARAEEAAREETLEAHKAAMIEAMNRRAAALNNQTRLKTMLSSMESRMAEVTETCEAMRRAGGDLEAACAEAAGRLRAETETQERMDGLLTEARADLAKADADVVEARQAYDRMLGEMREADSRHSLLSEMSREMEGYSNAVRSAVRYARETGMTGVRGVLNQLISVPRKYETALDMVLGNAQQDIVTEDEETAKALIDYLRRNRLGRATFLPMTAVKPRLLAEEERGALDMPGCLGVASELVHCDDEYRGIVENLLGRTVVAEDLDRGIPIMRAGGHQFRLVTLPGDVMHSGGSMTGGTAGQRMNLFSRERELKELTRQLEEGQAELERLLKAMQDGQARKDALKQKSADALEALHQQEIAVARETERARNAEEELRMHTLRLRETEAAREQLMESMMQIREQLSMVDNDTAQSGETGEEMEAKAAELQQALAEARRVSAEKAERTVALTLKVNDLTHTLEEMRRDRARYEKDRGRILQEQERRAKAMDALRAEDEADAAVAAERASELEKRRAEQEQREAVVQSLEEDRAKRQEMLKDLLSDMERLHESRSRDSDRAHRLELSRARTDGDLKAMQDRIWNTYEVTYAGAEEFRKTEGFSVTEADRRAAQLSAEIRALGAVNVRAVEEYADIRARYDDTMVQRQDLEKAEADLRLLISELLDEMKETFTQRFSLLQGYFTETFERLFGGGHAELTLMDPADPLNCGIEINAQPPGKRLQLLSLLSGGERTLTAIAILFATLKLKPTPFCILDEIEAALDDANIGYFADYLAEYSASTQFVVITHRKGTMERANGLYGVAMEEQGISRMVSVSLQDYRE